MKDMNEKFAGLMKMFCGAVFCAMLLNTGIHAQTHSVSMGHVNMIVEDLQKNRDFWETLGGMAESKNNNEYVKFPGVMIMMNGGRPSAGTVGSVINHFGLQFSNLEKTVETLRENGYSIITKTAVAGLPNVVVDQNRIATNTVYNSRYAFTLAPNGARIELYENKDLSMEVKGPVMSHHIHFYSAQVDEMKAWYVATFGAVGGQRTGMEAADIDGINLTFGKIGEAQAPTQGRALDHIGFEIIGLEAFCQALSARGIEFDQPYGMDPAFGFPTARLTDPWGTSITLTEGLAHY
jgi:catechol 2,3-dioxygenase-like lactoylglutathione lyase family enzyme